MADKTKPQSDSKTKVKRARRRAKYEWDADKVKALRQHLGLTQSQLADELGMLQQTISEWECGNHYPRGASVTLLRLVAEKTKFAYGGEAAEAG